MLQRTETLLNKLDRKVGSLVPYDRRGVGAFAKNSSSTRAGISSSGGVPHWPIPLGIAGAEFPLDFTEPHYNALYATVGTPAWPVPVPVTNPEQAGFSYMPTVGFLVGSSVYRNTNRTRRTLCLFTVPESRHIVQAYWLEEHSGFVWNSDVQEVEYRGVVMKPSEEGSGSDFPVSFNQVDPRVMVFGDVPANVDQWNDPMLRSQGSIVQQVMGGVLEYEFSVPWDGQATVRVWDPYVAPTSVGNKSPKINLRQSGDANNFQPYMVGQSRERPDMAFPGRQCFLPGDEDTSSKRYVLLGGGRSNRLTTYQRIINNTQDWCYYSANQHVPVESSAKQYTADPEWGSFGPFTGYPIYCVDLEPDQQVAVSAKGWMAYNVQLSLLSGAGLYLAQDSPIAYAHGSAVKNLPMTVACDYGGSSTHDRLSGETSTLYVGFPCENSPSFGGSCKGLPAMSADLGAYVPVLRTLMSRMGLSVSQSDDIIRAVMAGLSSGRFSGQDASKARGFLDKLRAVAGKIITGPVGTAIGGALGGPVGAAIGGAAGTAIGGALR